MRLGLRSVIAAAAVIGLAGEVMAQAGTRSAAGATLLVLSKREHALAVVDAGTLTVLAKVPVGEDPHEVIASADGRTAWVSNYGFGAFHTLTMVDLINDTAKGVVDLGPLTGPHGLTFAGGKTWFTAEGAKAIGRYDPAAGKVDWVLGTGQNRTHMIWVSADEKEIVTTNVSSGTVSLMEMEPVRMPGPPRGAGGPGGPGGAVGGPPPGGGPGGPGGSGGPGGPPRVDWNETVIPVGRGSEGFDVSPDGREIWVANAGDGTVSVIDVAGRRVVATLAAGVPGANRLKFTPDGRRVLVSSLGAPALTVLDARTRKVLTRVDVGHGAAGIVMDPGGERAFVACSPDGYVAVVDLGTMTVVGRVDAGGEPDGMAWAVR